MKYFNYLNDKERKWLFYKEPVYFDKNLDVDILPYCVGPLLYVPTINLDMMSKCFETKDIISVALCLEDSVGSKGERESIENLSSILESLRKSKKVDIPLIFVRPKNLQQMYKLRTILVDNLHILTGIIIPKANAQLIGDFLNILKQFKCEKLFVMPIIETLEFINFSTKTNAFLSLYDMVKNNIDKILNIRVGAADILGAYGIRRNKSFTIYDNLIFNRFTSDLISVLYGNSYNNKLVISGGVFEFYNMSNKVILNSYIKEINLDKLNGFIGKTVIHPSQAKILQIMSIIKYEDYIDALSILNNIESKFGVSASLFSERMNEVNPHFSWAKKIIILSKIYGVFSKGMSYEKLLEF